MPRCPRHRGRPHREYNLGRGTEHPAGRDAACADDGSADIGWLYDGGVFAAPPATPPPVLGMVSDRQFFHACAKVGMITQAEALAVKTGDIPAELQAIVDAIPDQEARFDAQMFLSGAVEFRRDHPLTEAVRLARGMTQTQVDDLFRLAGSL